MLKKTDIFSRNKTLIAIVISIIWYLGLIIFNYLFNFYKQEYLEIVAATPIMIILIANLFLLIIEGFYKLARAYDLLVDFMRRK